MSKVKDTQHNTFGTIAAVQTLAENYPSLKNTDSIMDSIDMGTSLGYLLGLLRIIGVTETDLVNWLSRLLCGENLWSEDGSQTKYSEAMETAGNGLLTGIEYAIKGVLFANFKNLFGGCPINPIIPDWLLDAPGTIIPEEKSGLRIPIALIDSFGTLKANPCDESGSIYYFDVAPNIFGGEYSPLNINRSTDFNAFLWYVINKSGSSGCIWDNRNNVKKTLLNCPNLCEEFYKTNTIGKIEVTGEGSIKKKQILKCQYIDSGAINDGGSSIKVTLPAAEYRRKDKATGIYMNKTIFEFNYDYIFSLKLFDTKTVVANIINSLLCLGSTVNLNYSIEKSTAPESNTISNAKNIIKAKLEGMINNVMKNESDEDTEGEECAKTFSNDEYDSMLKKSELKQAGSFTIGDVTGSLTDADKKEMISQIQEIASSDDQATAVENAINKAASLASSLSGITVSDKFSCQSNFIYNFIHQTVTEIVMQVLSPKVAMLYAINSAIMGDISDTTEWEENFKFNSVDDIFDKFENLIMNIIKQITEILIKQLFEFFKEKITPIIKIFAMQILLETIKDYKDLITQLVTSCGSLAIDIATYPDGSLNIDDVNYADIVPSQTSPNKNC